MSKLKIAAADLLQVVLPFLFSGQEHESTEYCDLAILSLCFASTITTFAGQSSCVNCVNSSKCSCVVSIIIL